MSTLLYDHKWMDLKEDSNGEAFVKMGDDAVMIVPVLNKYQILFIEEMSIAYQSPGLTLPTGAIEPDEAPEITANRELQEEVGFKAERLSYIGTLHPVIKYMQWQVHVYLAQHLVYADREGDERSPVTARAVYISEIHRLINARQLTDSTSIAAIYLASQHLSKYG